ncbi:ABC transporter substrate-binding protein [Pengzhenrongella sp.]|jgi:multiple sugar transport system substrate-binding protein|uniref:ABC transporter substrate-binding protein n=1 Tax=Pengzhenrongella sp. TaxID=2888820 RepID=UPI002F9386C3
MTAGLSRRGFIGLAAMVGGTALAGCAPNGGGGGGSAAADSLTFRWWGGDERNKAYLAALAIFTKKSGIKVSSQYSGYDGYFDKLNTEFAGGNPPDLIQMDTALVSTYANKGTLLDLAKYIPKPIGLDTLYEPLRAGGDVKGKTYGTASGSGNSPVLFDKTLLEKLKVDVPTNDWTWDDFSTIAGETSKALGKGKYGAIDSSPDDSGAFSPWLRQRDMDLYLEDGTLGFDADALTEWFTFWAGLRKSGAVCPPNLLEAAGSATGAHPLIAGQVAMTTGWGLAQMAPLTRHELGIVIVPRTDGKTGQALSAGVLLCIPKSGKNPAGSAKLMDAFINDDDVIKAMTVTRGLPPSDKSKKLLLPLLDANAKRDVEYGDYVAKEVVKDALPAPATAPPGYGDAKTALDMAAKNIAFGKATISESVTQYFKDAKKALDV